MCIAWWRVRHLDRFETVRETQPRNIRWIMIDAWHFLRNVIIPVAPRRNLIWARNATCRTTAAIWSILRATARCVIQQRRKKNQVRLALHSNTITSSSFLLAFSVFDLSRSSLAVSKHAIDIRLRAKHWIFCAAEHADVNLDKSRKSIQCAHTCEILLKIAT